MRVKISIVLVVCILLLSACDRTTQSLQNSLPPLNSPANFTVQKFVGTWNRTKVSNALMASIQITDQKAYSFVFHFRGFYAAHNGELLGTATIISPTEALYFAYTDGDPYPYPDGTSSVVTFELHGHMLTVTANPDEDYALGFGSSVTIGGLYTQEKPDYTNADIVDKVFKTTELKKKARALLGDDNYRDMIEIMYRGVEWDQSKKKYPLDFYSVLAGEGSSVGIKIQGDKIYIQLTMTFYTNDANYRNRLPVFFDGEGDQSYLRFVYKLV